MQEELRYRVLKLFEANPKLTQRELAKELGISLGGVNYCVRALIDRGFVKVQNFSNSKNKFGYGYLLTPSGLSEKASLTGRFLKRKMQEYEQLKEEIRMLQCEVEKIEGDD